MSQHCSCDLAIHLHHNCDVIDGTELRFEDVPRFANETQFRPLARLARGGEDRASRTP